ncbi:hypothetical protein FSP39_022009, partial [Pinctada imbricata]
SFQISTILKATSDDDAPIPGYLYQEVNNITLESDGYCHSTLEYLVDRLNKPSCHVKFKVLKIMKYVVENGSPNFRLGLLKLSKGIAEATKFSGPPDPLHGNVPYQVVRKTAKELSQLLFDTEDKSDRNISQTTKDPSHSVGIGSYRNQSHTKMEGFGNVSHAPQKGLGQRLMQNISDLAASATETSEDQQREVLMALGTPGHYKPPQHVASSQNTYNEEPGSQQRPPVIKSKVPQHTPGRAGGGWEDSDDEEEAPLTSSLSSDKKSSDTSDTTKRLEHITVEDWSSEESLVESTVKIQKSMYITNQEITEFLKACTGCNCEKILEFITQRLNDKDLKIVLRCLIIIENIIQSDLLSADFISRVTQKPLVSLVESQTGTVTIKARKIIRILEWMTKTQILTSQPKTSDLVSTDTLVNNNDQQGIVDLSPVQPPDKLP